MKNLSVHTTKPLGEQLLEFGLLTDEQLQQALTIQAQSTDKLLGQVLVEENFLTEDEFESFMQTRIGIQQPLGELLIQKSLITRDQLNEALSVQMQSGSTSKPLGQLLVDRGAIDQATLDSIVKDQYEQQEKRRKKFVKSGQVAQTYDRTQVEDIQNMLAVGQIFLALAEALMPDERKVFADRFHIFEELYQGRKTPLPDTLGKTTADFFVHFLPILEMGVDMESDNPDIQRKYDIMNSSFYGFLTGFMRLTLPELKLLPQYYLNSLVLTEAPDSVMLREALYLVMRSPQLLPHGSLMTLRFLLNEFWGQRSILEQKGMMLVRHEDEVDLSDFFRPRIVDKEQDLEMIQHMEDHIFNQIEQCGLRLVDCPEDEILVLLTDLMEFYRTLLQTYKDWKVTEQYEDEEPEGDVY